MIKILLGLVLLAALTEATEDIYAQVGEGNVDLTMIQGNANLHWSFSEDRTDITFTITAELEDKWIALGVSSGGGMKWAEHFICNPADNTLKHGWSADYVTPTILEEEYSGLQEATVVDGTSTCRYTIPTESCMGEDYDIGQYMTRVIYATGDASSFAYHGEERGHVLVSFNIDQSLLEVPLPSEDEIGVSVHKWDIVLAVEIPAQLNSYYCSLSTHPDAVNYKAGMADAEADYPAESWILHGDYHTLSPYVHHIFMWHCPKDFTYNMATDAEHVEGEAFECQDIMYTQCELLFTGWAPGIKYPARANTGLKVNGDSNWSTLVYQIHYNNPDLHSGVVDTAAMSLYYTYEEPEQQTWLYFLGILQSTLQIPPNEKYYRATSHTPPECTASFSGQKLHGLWFHMHGVGHRAKISLIRDGVEHTIFQDSAYEYDFQYFHRIDPPLEILPGDQFYTECLYDTSKSEDWVYGGDYTEEEMCYVFLNMDPDIPAVKNSWCFTLNDPLNADRLDCEGMLGDESECFDFENEIAFNPNWEDLTLEVSDLSYRDFEMQARRPTTCDFDLPAELTEFYADVDAYQQLNAVERANAAWPTQEEDEEKDESSDSGVDTSTIITIVLVVVAVISAIIGVWKWNERKTQKELAANNGGSKIVVNEGKRQPETQVVGGNKIRTGIGATTI